MNAENIYLVELTDSAGTVHRFCTGIGYMSKPTDTPPNVYYAPRVDQPGLFRQSMFAPGTTSGSSTGGYGEITLLNTDGGLDTLVDLGFDGQLCVVKSGTPNMALSQFATVITGTPEQPELSWTLVTIRIKDRTALLNTPAQTTHYLGNNTLPDGIEGSSELKDKPKPRLFGVCNNVTPVCVNTSKLVYQVNSGPVYAITGVHDGGNEGQIIQGADYATSALLLAAVVPDATNPPTAPGQYLTCLAEGLFRLDAAPFMQITCDVIQGATTADRTAGQIIEALAAEKVGAVAIVAQSIIDLNNAAPYTVGIYTGGNDLTTTALLDTLCASVGAWFGFDNLGNFWCKQLTAPDAAQAVMTLTAAEDINIDRVATADGDKGVPVWRVNVDFSKNWTVQASGLAGSVAGNQLTFEPENTAQLTTDRRNLLAMEYIRVKAEDAAIQTLHLLSPEITRTTTLDSAADATAESERELALRKVRRDRLRTKLPLKAIQYQGGGFWDNEAISDLSVVRFGHTAVVFDHYLYVVGGVVAGALSKSVMRLDLSNPTSAWDDVIVPDLFTGVGFHGCIIDGNYMYVISGLSVNLVNAVGNVYRLDLSQIGATPAPYWTAGNMSMISKARAGWAAWGGYLYCVGGQNGASVYSGVDRLTFANPTAGWSSMAVNTMPSAVCSHACVVDGYWLYVIGGVVSASHVATCIRYDLRQPNTGVWEDATVSDLPAPSSDHACFVFNGYLYKVGGLNNTGILKGVLRLNLANPAAPWETASITDLPSPRQGASANIFTGHPFVVGGNTTGGAAANTWMWRSNGNPADISQLTSLGRTILVKHPRYGYTTGRPMKIIGSESDHKSRMITLELWG